MLVIYEKDKEMSNQLKRIVILVVSAIFLIGFSPDTIAESSRHWEFAGWHGGGAFPNVTFSPHMRDRVYLVSDVAGVWRSDDLGDNWRFMTVGLMNLNVSFLETALSDENILYAGTAGGLFRSNNGGENWEPCDDFEGRISFKRPANYRSIAVSKVNPAYVIIGTQDGILYITDDYGDTWSSIGYPKFSSGWESWVNWFRQRSPVTVVQFDLHEKGVYVALGRNLYYYYIAERSWKRLFRSSAIITDFHIEGKDTPEIFLAGKKQLFVSKDGGLSWGRTSAVPRGIAYRIAVLGQGMDRVITVIWNKKWHGGVCRSTDGGTTWQQVGERLEYDETLNPTRTWKKGNERFLSLKIDPFNPEVMLASSDWGVFRSDDGGYRWKEKIKGAANTVGSDIHITADGNILAATMDNGLLKSSDGGKTYKSLFPGKRYDPKRSGHVWRVLSVPLNQRKIIATSSPWNDYVNQVIISKDESEQFVLVRKSFFSKRPAINTMWKQGGYPKAITLDPEHPHIVYLGIDGDDGGGLYVSHDGGWHWKYSKGQPGSKRIYNALAVDPTNSKRLFWGAYGKKGGVYISEDRGKSWEYAFNQMTKIFDLRIAPDGWIYVAGDLDGPVIFVSKDHGQSWSLLKRFSGKGTAEALFIHPQDAKRIGVSTVRWHGWVSGKIYWSEDRGHIWKDITGDLPAGRGAAAMDYNFKDSSLYIIRYAGSIYRTKI